MLVDITVKDFLKELASGSPAPGGGSVSALAGSLGAALVAMVAHLTAGRCPLKDEEQRVQQNLEEALRLQQILQKNVDADTEAYREVAAAYRMPRTGEEDKRARTREIQKALRKATDLPLQVAQDCLDVLRLCAWAIIKGNPNAWSDAVVAFVMAQGGIEGALANVAINLGGIKDAAFKDQTRARARKISDESALLQREMSDLLVKLRRDI